MTIRCAHCGQVNGIPPHVYAPYFICFNCGNVLHEVPPPPSSDTSEAVGLIGGAALGAALGGPFGAIIGAIIGAVIARETKGAD